MKKVLFFLYFLAAIIFCYAVIIENDLLRTIAKPIPLIILLITVKPTDRFSILIFIGLIFSLLGDIFLMKVIDIFLLGLVSFLIAHIFYIIAFTGRNKKIDLLSSIPIYFIAIVLGYYFYPHLGDMMIPVFVYIFVIMTMVWRSYTQRKFNKYAIFAFIGAVLFAVSDTNIALTKFIQDYEYSKIVTIIFYWSAQFLISLSVKKVQ